MKDSTELRRNLRTVFQEGVAYSVMVGVGESYLPAFVLALGMGEVASGLVATLPLIAGGALQLVSQQGIRLLGSHRRWAVLCAVTQATMFAPLVWGALRGQLSAPAVFLIATVYWGAGLAVGPAWNVWVEKLIPQRVRTNFFARRQSAASFGVLTGLLCGGLILHVFKARHEVLTGFAALFALAGISRFVSAGLLRSQGMPAGLPVQPRTGRIFAPVVELFTRPGASLLVYMLALTTTVTIASPFFTAFMLRQLGLSYAAYTLLMATSLAAKALSLPMWGKVAPRLGLRRLLRGVWLGISLLPGLWLVSDKLPYLMCLQLFGGMMWAAQEYVTFLLLFEVLGAKERGPLLTAFNFGNAVASAGGSLLGGAAFHLLGVGLPVYRLVFGASTAARLACFFLLTRIPGVQIPDLAVTFRTIGVRPGAGGILRPIISTLRSRRGHGGK